MRERSNIIGVPWNNRPQCVSRPNKSTVVTKAKKIFNLPKFDKMDNTRGSHKEVFED